MTSTSEGDASTSPAASTTTLCGWCTVRDCDSCRPEGTGWACACTHDRRIARAAFDAALAGALAPETTPSPETS